MEFFVFPYSDDVIFKTLHPVEVEASDRPAREIGEDSEATFKTICDLCAAVPILTPSLQRLMMRMMGKSSRRVGPAHAIFPSERNIRFEEMEYELPRAAGLPTLKAAMAHIRKRRLPITFPFEFRLAAGDDIWMSPFNAGPRRLDLVPPVRQDALATGFHRDGGGAPRRRGPPALGQAPHPDDGRRAPALSARRRLRRPARPGIRPASSPIRT
jgi:hypothetical protein